MRSSTSSSKSPGLVHAKVLAGICVFLFLGFEILSDYLLQYDSRTYQRVSRQYAEAVTARPARPGEPTSVLIVGNSLLLAGVDVERLRELTSGNLRVYPIFLEATAYYDWLYGLRRIFRQGARPQAVVVGLPVSHFLGNGIRQDYSPKMLFDARDIFHVASDLGLGRTATSNLLLEHSSMFWGTRGALRAQILSRIVPDFEDLASLIKTKPTIPQSPEFEAIAVSRTQSLRDLCAAHGAKLIILLPPTPSSEGAVREMAAASKKAGVDTIVPIDPRALSARFYQPDATHLNPEGAALFTSALATALPQKIRIRETANSPD
jgi:hypothetical protein